MSSGPPGDEPAHEPEHSLAVARDAGIHELAISTPFLVGRVNC